MQDDDDEEDEGADGEGDAAAGGVRTGGVDVDAGEEARDDGIPVQEIDAYWLQRRVSKAFGDIDPNAAQKLAEDTYAALEVRGWVGLSL
jgi:pre-mRNA-splicing helicase BRR2